MLQFSRRLTGGAIALVMRATDGDAAHQWLRGMLVTLEVALAVVLLVGAGLFLASFARVASVDLGIDPRDVLTVRIRPLVGADNWQLAQQRNRGLLDDVLERVRDIPGVETAALVSGGVPLRGDLRTIDFAIPGRVLPRGTGSRLQRDVAGLLSRAAGAASAGTVLRRQAIGTAASRS